MSILIYAIYYCLAIMGFFVIWYYCTQLKSADYYQYKLLNKKRKWAIGYFYFILISNAVMIVWTHNNSLLNKQQHDLIIVSIFLISFSYFFFLQGIFVIYQKDIIEMKYTWRMKLMYVLLSIINYPLAMGGGYLLFDAIFKIWLS